MRGFKIELLQAWTPALCRPDVASVCILLMCECLGAHHVMIGLLSFVA